MAGAAPVQTQEDLVPPPPAAIGYRWAGVLLAPAVVAVVHLALTGPFGLELMTPEGPGGALEELTLLKATRFTFVVALIGWLVSALLERGLGGERGRRIWTIVAVVVFVLSVIPLAFIDISPGARWGLFALHASVAVVLIPTLANGTPATHPVAGGWVAANAAARAQEDTHMVDTTARAVDPEDHRTHA